MGSETTLRYCIVAAIAALVTAISCLLPHLRAETFTPVLIPSKRMESVDQALYAAIRGNVAHPGLYSVDSHTELGDLLRLAGAGSTSTLIAVEIPSGPDQDETGQKIDINRADAWLLDALPGIGPEKAQAIVEFRRQHGNFARAEELMLVSGIGAALFDGLEDLITVTG